MSDIWDRYVPSNEVRRLKLPGKAHGLGRDEEHSLNPLTAEPKAIHSLMLVPPDGLTRHRHYRFRKFRIGFAPTASESACCHVPKSDGTGLPLHADRSASNLSCPPAHAST